LYARFLPIFLFQLAYFQEDGLESVSFEAIALKIFLSADFTQHKT
jgi:hypothetical protein